MAERTGAADCSTAVVLLALLPPPQAVSKADSNE